MVTLHNRHLHYQLNTKLLFNTSLITLHWLLFIIVLHHLESDDEKGPHEVFLVCKVPTYFQKETYAGKSQWPGQANLPLFFQDASADERIYGHQPKERWLLSSDHIVHASPIGTWWVRIFKYSIRIFKYFIYSYIPFRILYQITLAHCSSYDNKLLSLLEKTGLQLDIPITVTNCTRTVCFYTVNFEYKVYNYVKQRNCEIWEWKNVLLVDGPTYSVATLFLKVRSSKTDPILNFLNNFSTNDKHQLQTSSLVPCVFSQKNNNFVHILTLLTHLMEWL